MANSACHGDSASWQFLANSSIIRAPSSAKTPRPIGGGPGCRTHDIATRIDIATISPQCTLTILVPVTVGEASCREPCRVACGSHGSCGGAAQRVNEAWDSQLVRYWRRERDSCQGRREPPDA